MPRRTTVRDETPGGCALLRLAGLVAVCAWTDADAKPPAQNARAAGSTTERPAIESFSRIVRECVKCHPAESKTQPLTPMAHAAETNAECSVLRSHPLMKVRLGRYDYRIERQAHICRRRSTLNCSFPKSCSNDLNQPSLRQRLAI